MILSSMLVTNFFFYFQLPRCGITWPVGPLKGGQKEWLYWHIYKLDPIKLAYIYIYIYKFYNINSIPEKYQREI